MANKFLLFSLLFAYCLNSEATSIPASKDASGSNKGDSEKASKVDVHTVNEEPTTKKPHEEQCPGNGFMGASGDFGKLHGKITKSCYFDLSPKDVKDKKLEKDGYMLIVFKYVHLFPGDELVIKSNGQHYLGPYTDKFPVPESMIVGPNARIDLKVGTWTINDRSKNDRTIYGYFTKKDVFVHPIKSNIESSSIAAPSYVPTKKYFHIHYQFNIKPLDKKDKRARNYIVWFESKDIENDQLTLKQHKHKDMKIDPQADYVVGPLFGVMYDLNASNQNNKKPELKIHYQPINVECSTEIGYLNVSTVFKPAVTSTNSSVKIEPFNCLIIVRKALSPLTVKISNLHLNDKLRLDAKDGPSTHSRTVSPTHGNGFIQLQSTNNNLWISITGSTPIPHFEVDLDCSLCKRRTDESMLPKHGQLSPISENESPNESSSSALPLVLTSLFGAPAVVFVVFLGYKKYRRNQRPILHNDEDHVLFTSPSLIHLD